MKLFRNKRGSELVEKIIMLSFSVAMGGVLVVYTSGVINSAKNGIRMAVESNVPTRAALAFHWYSHDDGTYNFENMKIRYTGFISADLWNTLNAESPIVGYGIKFAGDVSYLNGSQLKDVPDDGTNVIMYYSALGAGKESPALANESQKAQFQVPIENDYYVFSLGKTILATDLEGITPEETIEKYTTPHAAAAYIRLENGENVFCPQIIASVKDVARNELDTGHSDSETAGGSINYLANL